MENIRQKIAEIITHTHKTPLEQADEILLLFGVSGQSEQFVCGANRVMGEKRCERFAAWRGAGLLPTKPQPKYKF